MRPIVFLDCETTGLNKQHDRIIQLSALRFDRETMKPTARFDYIIRPSGEWEMSAGAEEVHGITKEMVENSGKYLTEVIEEFDNIIRDADIAGYNSNSFDIQLLYMEYLRLGKELDMNRKFYDVYLIEKHLNPCHLGDVFKKYMGKTMEECGLRAHDSLSDVKATATVLIKQLEKISWDELNSLEFNEMVSPEGSIIRRGDGNLYFNIGKHRDYLVEEVFEKDPSYVKWWATNVATPHSKNLVKTYLKSKGF